MSLTFTKTQKKYLKEALIISVSYKNKKEMIPTEWRYLISPIWTIVNKVCNKKDLEKYEEKLSKCPNYEKINEFFSKLVEKIKNTEVCVDKDLFLKKIDEFSTWRMNESVTQRYEIDKDNRIRALQNFIIYPPNAYPFIVHKGDLGGIVSGNHDLLQHDNSWIGKTVKLEGDCSIKNNTFIYAEHELIIQNCKIEESLIMTHGKKKMSNSTIIKTKALDNHIDESFIENSKIVSSNLKNVDIYQSEIKECKLLDNLWVDNCCFHKLTLFGNRKYKDKTTTDLLNV